MQSCRDTVISAQLENTDYDDLHYHTVGTGSRDPEQASRQPSLRWLQGTGLKKQTKEFQPRCTEDRVLNTAAADYVIMCSWRGPPSVACL